jgi:hypothetical protein
MLPWTPISRPGRALSREHHLSKVRAASQIAEYLRSHSIPTVPPDRGSVAADEVGQRSLLIKVL